MRSEANLRYLGLQARARAQGQGQELSADQLQQTVNQAAQIQKAVLSAEEASGIELPGSSLTHALNEIKDQYETADQFATALAAAELSEDEFTAALDRELRVEAVLDLISTQAKQVGDTEVAQFYDKHVERFQLPERRITRHILITLDEASEDNRRDRVRQRMAEIQAQLEQDPALFADLAQRYSECPTALNGGLLGEVHAGLLFGPLDEALFAMQPGEICGPLESEMGLHLLSCEAILAAEQKPLDEVKAKLREALNERNREACRRSWIQLQLGRLQDAAREVAPA